MGLSIEGARLAQLKYGEAVSQLNKEIQQRAKAAIDRTPDGIGQNSALRQLYVEFLKRKSEAFINAWLESWQAVGSAPTDEELGGLHEAVTGAFLGGPPSINVHPLPPLTKQRIMTLETETHNRLERRVLEMRLQIQRSPTVYTANIENNYGPIQQGPGNTQHIKVDDENKSRS